MKTDARWSDGFFRRRRLIGAGVAAGLLTFAVAATAAEPKRETSVRFTEVSAAAGIDFVHTIGDDTLTNIVEANGVGCAFLDYDSDGWLDIYLVSACWADNVSDPTLDPSRRRTLAEATDRLYRNRGDGTFEDVTQRAGLARPGYGMGVVVADYDGDGDPDLYVTNYGPNFLYRNKGDGTFEDVAVKAGVDDPRFSVGAVFFDYNRDGRLDLYVGSYVQYDPDDTHFYAPDGFPGPLTYAGQTDRLFRGNADGTFSDVSREAKVVSKPPGRAMGIGVVDFDADGWLDIFVANDAMENFLFRNHGGKHFENEALLAGVAFGQSGNATAAMGVEAADIDNDGRIDLFVPDMTFTCLYRNLGDGLFDDLAARSGIAEVMGQYHGWGSVLADFDLDSDLDLYIANGDVHHLEPHEDVLFRGDGSGRFTDASETAGEWIARQKHVGRGVAGGDFDNDGDIDLLVVNLNDRPALLRNDTPRSGRHWLGVKLVGRDGNRDAIGAIVTAQVGDKRLTRQRMSGGSYLSQHDPRLHFGLGRHATVDRLEIRWPDGTRRVVKNVRADQMVTVRQAPSPAASANGDGREARR